MHCGCCDACICSGTGITDIAHLKTVHTNAVLDGLHGKSFSNEKQNLVHTSGVEPDSIRLHVALKVLLFSTLTIFGSFRPFPVTLVCLMSQTCLTHVHLFPASCCQAALTALTWRMPGQHSYLQVMVCGLAGLVVLARPFSAAT